MSGIEAVLSVLETHDFHILPKPLLVGGTTFDFDAAVTGTGASHDLVVIGAKDAPAKRVSHLLAGLSRNLDRLESRRPVTLVLLGPRPPRDVLSRLEIHARIILIEDDEPTNEAITQAIAILLPLTLPSTSSTGVAPLDELVGEMTEQIGDDHQTLIDASIDGPEAVTAALQHYIDQAFDMLSGEL